MPRLKALTAAMRAGGEESRLRILALLSEGELSVKDIGTILEQSQPRVSRHLRILANAGLVERHAEGAWAYFGLADSGFAGALGGFLTSVLSRDDGVLKADRGRYELLRERQQGEAAAYFSKVAESWDMLRSLHAPEREVEAAILETVADKPAGSVIDLGTGSGRMLELLAEHYTRGTGIDSSREMIAVARAKLAAAGIAHAQIRLGDITALDPETGPADLIVLHQVLHYFDDPGQVLRQVHGVLKPSGTMLIVDFEPHRLEFLRERHAHRRLGLDSGQLASWARAAGFKVTSKRSVPSTAVKEGLTVSLWCLGGSQPAAGEKAA